MGTVATVAPAVAVVVGAGALPATGQAAASPSATRTSAGTLGTRPLLGVTPVRIRPGLWAEWTVPLPVVAPQTRRGGRVTVPEFVAERYGDGDEVRTGGGTRGPRAVTRAGPIAAAVASTPAPPSPPGTRRRRRRPARTRREAGRWTPAVALPVAFAPDRVGPVPSRGAGTLDPTTMVVVLVVLGTTASPPSADV